MNKNIKAVSFDICFLKEDSKKYKLESIFNNSINFVNEKGDILTLNNKLGFLRSITLNNDDFIKIKNKLEINDSLYVINNNLQIKEIEIILENNNSRDFLFDFSKINIGFFENNIDKILENLKKEKSQGIIQLFQDKRNMINEYLFNKIKEIDNNKNNITDFSMEILKYYSAGIGSTPSVDDVIVGMIIIAKAYNDDISVFKSDYNKTTNISRNMILNIIKNRVSDNIKNLYENDDINRVLELVKEIGSSSGIDMIVGTFLYIKKRRGEFCLRSSL